MDNRLRERKPRENERNRMEWRGVGYGERWKERLGTLSVREIAMETREVSYLE